MKAPLQNPGIRVIALVLAAGLATGWVTGCGFSPWPEHENERVDALPVDAPTWSLGERRFVRPGDSLAIDLTGIRTGYSCTRITGIEWVAYPESSGAGQAAYRPLIHAEIPGVPDCALQGTRDTAVAWAPTVQPGLKVKLFGSDAETAGGSVLVVSGSAERDSIRHVKNVTGFTSKGHYTYRDTSGSAPRMLFADSLPSCTFLNTATAHSLGDTTWVKLSLMHLDSNAVGKAWPCAEGPHPDSLPVFSLPH